MPPNPEQPVSFSSDKGPVQKVVPVLALSSTFTAEPLGEVMAFWMRELGFEYQIRFAPYSQVFQQLLDPGSLLASNRNGINILLLRFEDWVRFKPAGPLSEIERDIAGIFGLIESAARTSSTPFLVAICPCSPAFLADPERAHLSRKMEALAAARLGGIPGVHLITHDTVSGLYPVPDPHDPHGDELGHVPYAPAYFAALGAVLARRIHALRALPFKVIALDCDDTLWQGICGEDGPEGVIIDPPRRVLQEFMLAQRDAGMLLALASKNNPQDVEDTFRAHPEMPLRLEHFITTRLNWQPKPANLLSIAEELGLGLDTFILVDDSIKESSEVQANCPEVLALTLPAAPEEIPAFLRHVWAFDHLRVTEADRERSRQYAEQIERGRAERQTASLAEFITTLRLEIQVVPVKPLQMARVSQLTWRTNQMNLTAVRRTESEIREAVDRGALECLTVDVSDRFGSYGLAGVILFTASGGSLSVDTFLLSCRALGRGVEHRMLARLGEIALERGLESVDLKYRTTPRNAPALLFLRSIAADCEQAYGNELRFVLPASRAAQIRYEPVNGAPKPAAETRPKPATSCKLIDYERIARDLRDPERILQRVRAGRPVLPGASGTPVPPRSELEARLARIWTDTLGQPSIGVTDNFFDLGGHSLLAVELLSRVRNELGVSVSLEVVYSGEFTVAELAKAIELKELEMAGGEDYSALVAELDKLSDQEVRALLAQEGIKEP